MGTEQTAEFYTGDKYMRPDIFDRYEPLYQKAADMLPAPEDCPTIMDLGCGVGHFAKIVSERGYVQYLGVDFSSRMLKKAREQVPTYPFIKNDLLADTLKPWLENERLFVLLEVLEHIKDDMAVLGNIPTGSQVIFSVPTFDAQSHVRRFKNTGEVVYRYRELLRFDDIIIMPWKGDNKVFIFRCEKI
jgi:trans-aconitate methyltransferase